MKTSVSVVFCWLALVSAFVCAGEGETATTVETKNGDPKSVAVSYPGANGSGGYTESVPVFTLKDMAGVEHKSESLYKGRGMLVMITVPNLTQCERQKKWEKAVKRAGWPQDSAPACVVLEDMSQQQSYREKAMRCMQDKAREDSRELFIIDETGDVRRSFGVNQNETVILIVDANGSVIHHETDDVEPDEESASRVAQQVRNLAQANKQTAVAAGKNVQVSHGK